MQPTLSGGGFRIIVLFLCAGLLRLAACVPMAATDDNTAGNGAGNNVGNLPSSVPDFREPRSVPGFFAANEPWTFAAADEAQTRGVIVMGVGDLIETILLGTDRNCTFSHPESSVAFDGQVFSLATQFTALHRSSQCAVDVEAAGANCAGGSLSQACTLEPLENGSSATISGTTFPLAFPSIVRIPTCTHSLFTIINGGEWGILNVHPLSVVNSVPENAGGVVLVASGTGFRVSQATVCPHVDSRGDCIGCLNSLPTGQIDAEGNDFTLDIVFAAGATQCSIRFNGTARYCATFDTNPADGISGPPLFRIEGEGTFSSGETSGNLHVLYLFGEEPFIRR